MTRQHSLRSSKPKVGQPFQPPEPAQLRTPARQPLRLPDEQTGLGPQNYFAPPGKIVLSLDSPLGAAEEGREVISRDKPGSFEKPCASWGTQVSSLPVPS